MTELAVAAFIMFFGSIAIIAVLGRSYARWSGLVLLGLTLRLMLAVADRYYIDLPQSSSDAKVFLHIATTFARAGCGDFGNFDISNSYVYSAFVGQVFACLGKSQLGIQFLNCIAGVIGAISMARVATIVWSQEVANKVCLILLLFPTLILYSAVTLRESLIFMFFSQGMLYYFRTYQKASLLNFVYASLALLAASALHSGMLFAIFALIASLALGRRTGRKERTKVGTICVRVLISIVLLWGLYVYIGTLELNKFGNLASLNTQSVSSLLERRAEGGSAYLQDLKVSSPIDLIWQTPIRMFYFLFSPLPWDIRSPSHLFGLADVAFWYYVTFLIARNRRSILSNPPAVVLLSVFAALTIAFSFGTSNFGTAMRHRAKFVPILFVIAGPALSARRKRGYELIKDLNAQPSHVSGEPG